jgi:hypothetical protein
MTDESEVKAIELPKDARIRVVGPTGNATDMHCPDGEAAFQTLIKAMTERSYTQEGVAVPAIIEAYDETRSTVKCAFHPDEIRLVFKLPMGNVVRPNIVRH